MIQDSYANIPQRVKAAFIDSIVLLGMIYGVSELFALFETVPTAARVIAFICVFVLYDPVLTSIYGGTMGHSFSGIQVKRDGDRLSNISFPIAVLRFLLKATLGWVSLLTVSGNTKKQALHDLAAGSVVIEETKNS